MFKKILLLLVCIVNINYIRNAKEIVEITKDTSDYKHCAVYIKFDDDDEYFEMFNNPFDCEDFYYGMTHKPPIGEDINPLGLTKEEQEKFHAPVKNEAIDAWTNRPIQLNVIYDDNNKNNKDEEEYNDFKKVNSVLDLLF